jgi:nucleoside-diphosphate-sugar epimerase
MTATDRLRTVGMRNLIEAASAVGATRMITENMIFGYGYGQHAGVLVEDSVFGPPQSNRHLDKHVAAMRTKEQLTLETPGLDGVSLRFGLFYGPGGTDPMVEMLRKRTLPAPASGGRVLPWVHLADAADAVLAAIEHGRAGQAYNIVDGGPLGFGDQIRATATAFGTPKPLALPTAAFAPLRLLHALLRTDMRVSSAKAANHLGFTPKYSTVADGLAEMTDMA